MTDSLRNDFGKLKGVWGGVSWVSGVMKRTSMSLPIARTKGVQARGLGVTDMLLRIVSVEKRLDSSLVVPGDQRRTN